jgi:signal transduction histidine kinase/PAS domain-containing protein
LTIARRLYLVLGIMVLLISAELSALWFTIHTLSAVRAYVAGEGIWSKAEKDAAYHLEAYGLTRDPKEYQAYLGLLGVWAGDHQANVELSAPNPDPKRIFAGFLKGGNDPEDIPGMVALFARFSKVSFIAQAIAAWTEGDVLMERFQQLGSQLHAQVLAGKSEAAVGGTLMQIGSVNAQMTLVEDRFSDTLGVGSRWLTGLVLKVLLGAALVVELTGLLFTAAITRGISLRLRAMLHASERVGHGDFSVALDEGRKDEIGRLAASFNGMTRDVGRERRRAEDAVAASEASLREAQRVAHIGVWDWTFANNALSWSREVCRLHDMDSDSDELSYSDFLRLVHPDDVQRVDRTVRSSRSSGRPFLLDYRVALPNGALRWLCAEGKVECDSGDRPVRMLGTTRDITEPKLAEKLRLLNAEFGQRALATADLAELKRQAVEIVAGTLVAPFVRLGELDATGTAVVLSTGVGWPVRLVDEHWLGATASPQAEESIRSCRPVFLERIDESGPEYTSLAEQALGIVASATIPILGKDSVVGLLQVGLCEPRVFSQDDATFLTSIGTIMGMAIDRYRREGRIKHLNSELQHRYAELETFSYSVAHDLRAPLRAVSGFASALQDDYGPALDDEARRYISLIVGGADQMGGLIDALLKLAQVSRQEISSRDVDLSAKARSIISELQAADPERKATATVEDGLMVAGDSALLSDLLANLLGNAWKFTRGRDPAVIRFESQPRNGQAVYAIKDNGIGFSTLDPDKLFEPFKRLHGKTYEGTGIGLATVARIVHRHGGRVWAESEPGAGATFYFTLGDAG